MVYILEDFLKLNPGHICTNCSRMAVPNRKHCKKCAAVTRKSAAKWLANNRELYRAVARTYRTKKRLALKAAIFVKLGHSCKHCGFVDKRALQIDHVYGRGLEEYRRLSEFAFYKKVLNDTEGLYQILCANCNWIKRYENGEVPHGKAHPSWRSS